MGFLHSLGQKISGGLHAAMKIGDKVAHKVSGIASKVLGISKYVKPFIPAKYGDKVDKALRVVAKAGEISGKVSGGIAQAKTLEKKVRGTKGASQGFDVAKEVFYAGKNAVNSTRTTMERPTKKDNTSSQNVMLAPPKPSERAARRAVTDQGMKAMGGGLMRAGGGDVAKAAAAAAQAQKLVARKPGRMGGLLGGRR